MIFGIISYQSLPVRQLPQIDKPIVTITTDFAGADADLMENQITTPIENALAGISGLEYMRSSSSMGESSIKLKFDSDADINEALNDIRNKLAHVKGQLPQQADDPIIEKADSDNNPALILSFSDVDKSPMEITDYINRYIKPELQQVDGVGRVFFFGARTYAVRIWLDAKKMAAHQITATDISNALAVQNISVPSGQIKSLNRYYTVITNAKFAPVHDFNNVILKEDKGAITRLSDVAKIEVGSENIDSGMRIDGENAVGVGIIPQTMANPVDVSNDVIKAVKFFKGSLPQGMKIKVT